MEECYKDEGDFFHLPFHPFSSLLSSIPSLISNIFERHLLIAAHVLAILPFIVRVPPTSWGSMDLVS